MSWNGNIFRVSGYLCREFTDHRGIPRQRPVTRCLGVFFDLRLNKRLSKQSWGRRFETPSHPLWCHCNVLLLFLFSQHHNESLIRHQMWSHDASNQRWLTVHWICITHSLGIKMAAISQTIFSNAFWNETFCILIKISPKLTITQHWLR